MRLIYHLMKVLTLFSLFILISACSHITKTSCEQNIIAFDFGSGSIKKKNPNQVLTPNPMTRAQLNQALKLSGKKPLNLKYRILS